MPYLGNTPADKYSSYSVQHFTTSATTSYTLDFPVANENEIELFINNVRQEPGSSYAYTASGTSLTLSAATSASDTMYCVFQGKSTQTVAPATGSVTGAMLSKPFNYDSGTFYLDDTNNRIGIGTTSPQGAIGIRQSGYTSEMYFTSDAVSAPNDLQIYIGDGGPILKIDDGFVFRINHQSAERIRINSTGNVLVGTTDDIPWNNNAGSSADAGIAFRTEGKIAVAGYNTEIMILNRTGTDGTIAQFRKDGTTVGTVSVTTSSTSYNTSSDYRLKENVVEITGATERLKQLQPKRFNFIADPNTIVDGFIAHEVQSIVPEAISGEKDAMKTEEYEVTPAELDEEGNVITEAVMGTREVPVYQGIDQSKLVPLLVATIKELEARITELENA